MSTHEHKPPTVHEHGISGYDKKDVTGKPVAWSFIVLTVITIACAIVALVSWNDWKDKRSSGAVAVLPVAQERALPELPRLQEMPQLDIKALHAEERTRLDEYAWIDKQAGIVQIPIDRAMELIAERGLPHGREAHVPTQGQAQAAPAAPAQK